MELHDWLVHYLKRKDSVELSIRKIETLDFFVIADHGERRDSYFVKSKLEPSDVKEIIAGKILKVCTENSEENFQFLVKNWKELCSMRELLFIFVNLSLGEKWIICPYSHNFIADEATLEAGLRTMFDTANGKIVEVKPEKGRKPKLFEETDEDDEDEEE